MTLDAPAATELHHLGAAEAARMIAARRISPVELTAAVIARAEAVQPMLNTYIELAAEPAMEAARAAEAAVMAGGPLGPLHGVPFAAKDNYHVEGMRTTGGSRLMLDYVADHTATLIERLVAGGSIFLGKLNTWEFGTGSGEVHDDLPFPLARNPWNVARFTGGSSTGAGVAVAAGAASFALGSDTGGSIRLPAAATGVQGMKATFGRMSRRGIHPNCWSADVGGALTWTVEDSARAMQVMAGFDPLDPQSADRPVDDYAADLGLGAAGLRIGVIRDFGPDAPEIAPAIAANLDAMVAALRGAGAQIVDLAPPAPLSAFRATLSVINWGESYSIHETDFLERHHLMGRSLRDKMMSGFMLRAADYLAAQRRRGALARAVDAQINAYDAVLLPCTSITAPAFGDQPALVQYSYGAMTSIHSVTGHPAMAVPTGFDADGMPTAAQIAGPYFAERAIFRVAAAWESLQGPRAARPVL